MRDMTDEEIEALRNFNEKWAEFIALLKANEEVVLANYPDLMYNDFFDMQEQAFEVINEKAKERYPDE